MTRRGVLFAVAALALLLLAAREYWLLGSLKGPQPMRMLAALNAVVPGDAGARRVVRGAAYGPDPRQRLDVYAPAAPGPHPVVVFFYGGGWAAGSRDDYGFVGEALAGKGIVAIVADYRLVPQVRFPAFVEDGAAAVRWAAVNAAAHGGNPDRIAVMGHSAGSYIAAMLALDPRFGVADRVNGLVGLSGAFEADPAVRPSMRAAFAGTDDLRTIRPGNFASAAAPPALLLAGAADTVTAPATSVALARTLTAAGAQAEALVYPGIGHKDLVASLARPYRWQAPVLDDIAGFVAALPPRGAEASAPSTR